MHDIAAVDADKGFRVQVGFEILHRLFLEMIPHFAVNHHIIILSFNIPYFINGNYADFGSQPGNHPFEGFLIIIQVFLQFPDGVIRFCRLGLDSGNGFFHSLDQSVF